MGICGSRQDKRNKNLINRNNSYEFTSSYKEEKIGSKKKNIQPSKQRNSNFLENNKSIECEIIEIQRCNIKNNETKYPLKKKQNNVLIKTNDNKNNMYVFNIQNNNYRITNPKNDKNKLKRNDYEKEERHEYYQYPSEEEIKKQQEKN